jgi:hypothetical protein
VESMTRPFARRHPWWSLLLALVTVVVVVLGWLALFMMYLFRDG